MAADFYCSYISIVFIVVSVSVCVCDRRVRHQSWPVGEMSGDLHHVSDGIRVGTSHSADVKFGETLFLYLFKKTKHAAIKEEERHGVGLTDSCEFLLAHTPQRSSSGRCYSGGLCGRLSLRFPGRCSADSSWQTFYPVEQHTHRHTRWSDGRTNGWTAG